MPATVVEWEFDVKRGPGWLLVKPRKPNRDLVDYYPLADHIWSLMQRHFFYRVLIELEEVPALNSHLVSQLLLLYRRVRDHDGVMRLCGLSQHNRSVLEMLGLVDRFPAYGSIEEAVLGSWSTKPR
jgi:hypothetical protein